MVVSFRVAVPSDVVLIADNMRAIDREEIELSSGLTPLEALQYSYDHSEYCQTMLFDGVPVGMFGVSKNSLLSNVGCIWFLGTEEMNKVKKSFVVNSLPYINRLFDYAERLENYVWIENKLSIRWLKWCGFKFDEPAPYGVKKALFLHFYKEKV